MKNRIVGRYAEISRLDRCTDSSSAQLVVYGRRRVGKTFLIYEYMAVQIIHIPSLPSGSSETAD